MKNCRKTFPIVILVLMTSFLIMISKADAADLTYPYFNFIGDFNYTADTDLLALNAFSITQVTYLDQNSSNNDAISSGNVEWVFIADRLYNDPNIDSLDFGGPARFEIKDTVTSEVFLTASLSNFQLSQFCSTFSTSCFDPTLNIDYTQNSLWNLVIDPNYATSSSQYIQELGSVLNRNDGVVYNTDINFDFTFTSGDNQFINDGGGKFSGSLVIMPEPVSSILFLTGGILLAVRRYTKKRLK